MLARVITAVAAVTGVFSTASAQDVKLPQIDFGRYHALVIGNNDYQNLPKLDRFFTTYTGPKNPEVGRVGWSNDTVWLDAGKTHAGEGHRAAKPGTIGLRGVPKAVWDFHIGGYQVCHKWLKDRKGRTLSDDDIAHYQKVVVALNETIRLMAEIDEIIERHDGWPDAFVAGTPAEQ